MTYGTTNWWLIKGKTWTNNWNTQWKQMLPFRAQGVTESTGEYENDVIHMLWPALLHHRYSVTVEWLSSLTAKIPQDWSNLSYTHYLQKLYCSHVVPSDWDGWFLFLHRPGVLQEKCPKTIGWSGWGAWVWSCWRSRPPPPWGPAGHWLKPTSPSPGTPLLWSTLLAVLSFRFSSCCSPLLVYIRGLL